MNIDVKMHGDVCVVSPRGEIRMGVGDVKLRDAIKQSVEDGKRKVIIDMTDVRYMDSAGLGEVVACRKRVVEAQGEIKLAHLNQRLTDLFQLARLHLLFEVFDTVDDAVASFSAKSAG